MFCPKCGSEHPDDSQFCHKCGQGLAVPLASSGTTSAGAGTGAAVAPARIQETKSQDTQPKTTSVVLSLVAIAGAVLLILLLVVGYGTHGTLLKQQRVATIKNADLRVNALTYYSFKLDVPEGATSVFLHGSFTASGGAGNDIEVFVLPETDFVNWQNRHPSTSLYNSGKVTDGNLNVTLPTAGTYYLVFSNRFGLLLPKTVNVDATLTYYQ